MKRPEQIDFKLSDEQNNKIYEEQIKPFFIQHSNVLENEKRAFYLGAQPGSGKTGLGKSLTLNNSLSYGKDTVVINTDLLREYHPFYKGLERNIETNARAPYLVNIDAGIWLKRLIQDAQKQNLNLLFDSTLGARDIDGYKKGMQELSQAGYKLELHILAVRPELSRLGIYLRYENGLKSDSGRFVSMPTHDLNYELLPVNIEKVLKVDFNKISLYRRFVEIKDGQIKNNAVEGIIELKSPTSKDKEKYIEVLNTERLRPFNTKESKYFDFRYNEVLGLIKLRSGDQTQFKNDVKKLNKVNSAVDIKPVKLNFGRSGQAKKTKPGL